MLENIRVKNVIKRKWERCNIYIKYQYKNSIRKLCIVVEFKLVMVIITSFKQSASMVINDKENKCFNRQIIILTIF